MSGQHKIAACAKLCWSRVAATTTGRSGVRAQPAASRGCSSK
jgi:hypothetical protein